MLRVAASWDVTVNGRKTSHHRTKDPAVDKAVAKGNAIERGGGDAELAIKGVKGKIQDKRTYGDDPPKIMG